jgi:hypothetical protein
MVVTTRVLLFACTGLALSCGGSQVATAPARARVGPAMREIGERFERAGRAAVAERWDLAAYDVDEIAEVFAGDLGHTRWSSDAAVPVANAFAATSIPMMQRSLSAHDLAGFTQAFGEAASSCNSCHRIVDKPFIEVPQQLGATIPATTR